MVPEGIIPLVIFTGVAVNKLLLHALKFIAVIAGLGFTVTVIGNEAPEQVPVTGVTVYIAVCAVFVGLTNVPLILAPLPDAPPVNPPVTAGTVQA